MFANAELTLKKTNTWNELTQLPRSLQMRASHAYIGICKMDASLNYEWSICELPGRSFTNFRENIRERKMCLKFFTCVAFVILINLFCCCSHMRALMCVPVHICIEYLLCYERVFYSPLQNSSVLKKNTDHSGLNIFFLLHKQKRYSHDILSSVRFSVKVYTVYYYLYTISGFI